MQGVGQLNLSNCSKLHESSSSSLFVLTCGTSYLLPNGTWDGGTVMKEMHLMFWAKTYLHCPLSLKSLCSARWRKHRESSLSYILSACWACPKEGRVQSQQSVSLLVSLILLSLLTSSQNSVTRQKSFSTQMHLPQVCSLLPSSTGIRVGHALQPDIWVAARVHQSSVWEAMSVVAGADLREAMVFSWEDTIAPWSSRQSYNTLLACPSMQTATQTVAPCPC